MHIYITKSIVTKTEWKNEGELQQKLEKKCYNPARVIIHVGDTSSGPVLHFYQDMYH